MSGKKSSHNECCLCFSCFCRDRSELPAGDCLNIAASVSDGATASCLGPKQLPETIQGIPSKCQRGFSKLEETEEILTNQVMFTLCGSCYKEI